MSTTEASLSAVYADRVMNTTQYHLHAVLVHQGQASGGHYWSYVRKPPSLHVKTTPTSQATPTLQGTPTIEITGVTGTETKPLSSETVSRSESMSSSPVMSTEPSGGGGGGEGEGQLASTGEDKGEEGGEGRESSKEEGQGEGGVWLKFNDVSVQEVGWEEVAKESYGGEQNTSAYCLIYLSPQLHQSWASNSEPARQPVYIYTMYILNQNSLNCK